MSKVYIHPYSEYTVSGHDFGNLSSTEMRRVVMSPDNIHSLSLVELRDGCLLITNNSKIDFEFSISRNCKPLMMVTCKGSEPALLINTNWRLDKEGVMNREIHTNPDLKKAQTLNIDIGRGATGVGRIDLKIDESGFGGCVFSNTELLFIKMNGNHTVPRLEGFIENEIQREIEARFNHSFENKVQREVDARLNDLFENKVQREVQLQLHDTIERIANNPEDEVFKRIGRKCFSHATERITLIENRPSL